jgi:hypothetical protein
MQSPFAALETALGTKRFTKHLSPQVLETGIGCRGPKLVPSVPEGKVSTFGDGSPWGDELTKSDMLKRKQTPGSRFGIIMNDPTGPKFVGDYASPSGVMAPTKRMTEGGVTGEDGLSVKLSWDKDIPVSPTDTEGMGNGRLAGNDSGRPQTQQAARFGSQNVRNLWDSAVADDRKGNGSK